jgi:predicted permease
VIFFDPRLAGYQLAQLEPLYARIQDAIRRVPGVSRVALCIYSPLGGNNFGNEVWIDGHNTPGPNEDAESSWDRATAGYFSLIGNPILQGREIDERDTANSEHVAVINQAFARHFFGTQNPLGRYFGWANDSPTRYKIVGIAKDARYLSSDVDKPIQPFFFLPESQHDLDAKTKQERDYGSHYMRDIVVLSAPGSTISNERLRQALASVDPNLPITSIHPLSEQVDGIFRPAQLVARLASWFGCLSLVLSSLGLYGVAAYIAAQRFKEIGVRMALGAGRRHAVVLVLRGPFLLILAGLAVGFPLSVGTGQLLGAEIPGLQSDDALDISVAILSLAACGFAASVIPAIRASFISPSEALRAD